jgi:hypothetical protein
MSINQKSPVKTLVVTALRMLVQLQLLFRSPDHPITPDHPIYEGDVSLAEC